jgi:hypothetical protein
MRASKHLKRLISNDRGNALAIGAASLPLLIAGAALAVDTIQISLMRRQLQRAADSGAIAGAYALAQEVDTTEAVHTDLDRNYFPTLHERETITVGPRLGQQNAVRLQLHSRPTLPFLAFFTKDATDIRADATAAVISGGRFCMLSLYDGEETGIDVGGNAEVNLGCGMASNSRGSEAVTAGGSSKITASPIMAVGGLDGTGNNFAQPTVLQPHSTPQPDPYLNLPDPVAPTQACTALSVKPGETVTIPIDGRCFSSMNIKGTVTFTGSGQIPIYGGDVIFGSQANITATGGATFVMTGPNGQAGDVKMNGQATLNLKAPESGDLANVLFYRDRRASAIEIKINGGANMQTRGAFYFPTSDVTFTGHAGMKAECFQLIGQILKFRGTAAINNFCSKPNIKSTFELQFVRLIG